MKNISFVILSLFILSPPLFASERNYVWEDYPIYENSFSRRTLPAPSKKNLKIVSYNIKFSENMEKVLSELTKNENLKNADVILLQEVVGIPGDNHAHAAEIIAKNLNLNYAYAPAFVHQKNELDFGVAILSKYPLSDVKKIILPHVHFKFKTQRIAIGATININGKELRLYSAHLETLQLSSQRIDQIHTVIADTFTTQTDHILIGGDLNTAPFWHRIKLERYMKRQGFLNATKKIGTTMKKARGLVQFKLDHIFTKGLDLLGKGKAKFTNGSDHHPVWVDARLNDPFSPY